MARPLRIGVAGAGLLGRLLAHRLGSLGHRVEVFDPAAGAAPTFDGAGAAGFTAAGMLSPLAELDASDVGVGLLGLRSLQRWPQILRELTAASTVVRPPAFVRAGSLLVAHGPDRGAAQRILARIHRAPAEFGRPRPLTPDELVALEPAVARLPMAWMLENEGLIDPPATLQALHDATAEMDVHWHWGMRVDEVSPGELIVSRPVGVPTDATANDVPEPATSAAMAGRMPSRHRYDLAIDVRGVGARQTTAPDDSSIVNRVRGVRGETVWLQLTGHGLVRPLRLLHPRHRVYVVPRSDGIIVVGASEIESEDRSPVSLRSAVELMAAAHSVMPRLAEARIIRLDRNLRPALADNDPAIENGPGFLRINGLFRHGWLLAPALLDDAMAAAGLD